MKRGKRLTGTARVLGLLVVLALLFGLLLPLVGVSAQESDGDVSGKVGLAEVPSTGARRPGPVILNSSNLPDQVPAGFAPVELQVDSIGLDAPVEEGTIVDGAMQDPSGPWVVSWYSQLSKVGQGRNVVMAGHVDYWDVGPAIFQGIPSLQPGDIIRVVGEDGEVVEYSVEWTRLFDVATELTPEVIKSDIVGDTGQESLTLITCGGQFDGQEYLQRQVVRANKI
jgi:sortase (surface protein transpeptidase)